MTTRVLGNLPPAQAQQLQYVLRSYRIWQTNACFTLRKPRGPERRAGELLRVKERGSGCSGIMNQTVGLTAGESVWDY